MPEPRRLAEARQVLAALGMPKPQQNPNAIYTLLAFTGVGPRARWPSARNPRLTPHDVIAFADRKYGKTYAENTRETIRRHAIHQFVQGGILIRNPDDPTLATNSPLTHYALTDEALAVIRAFGSAAFPSMASRFRAQQGGGLAARYAKARDSAGLTVELPSGGSIHLSPGAHNALQVRVLEEFVPRFAAGTRLLYLGDTDLKTRHVETEELASIGFPITKHDKLPDIVLFDEAKSWLFLVEVVTSHGPVSPKRHMEVEAALAGCRAGRIYVSAFPSFREFKRHAAEIAWETEVWIAEFPEHLLHYNGDRFFGPRR